MSSNAGPKVPSEVSDAIIDQVAVHWSRHRTKLLGVCGLVCKSWLPRSRFHLFEHVVALTQFEFSREWDIRFLDLIDNPLCTVKPFVQTVTLMDVYEPMILRDALLRLSTLPFIRELLIYGAKFTTWDLSKTFASFPKLQHLSLDNCRFRSNTQLHESLSICTSLQRLTLFNIHPPLEDDVIRFPPPSSLRHVIIGDTSMANSFEWLSLEEPAPPVEAFEAINIDLDAIPAMARCFRAFGPSLKYLQMDTGSTEDMQEYSSYVDLSHNPNLSSITFHNLCVSEADPSSLNETHIVPSLLAQITSSELRQVVMDVLSGTLEMVKEIDWDRIARILQQPNFCNLEKLILSGIIDDEFAKVKSWLEKNLPAGRAKDKLILRP